ncbi:hypothetical protein SteCoe_11185 [Stentor coeruleus]|uniref:Uncharacterized protein n=1 Tax=Stentor coeruleus TaxID=5963 RepID=A0A1R2CDT8_9CILI|nr:hypothetical protein SteCoe_11185 [Stentor coeruleus]
MKDDFIDEDDCVAKILKVKKENAKLQKLLENAENEMKTIVKQSHEESMQLKNFLQSVWPKLQNRGVAKESTQKISAEKSSKLIQTENPDKLMENLQELEICLNALENAASSLLKTQSMLRYDLDNLKTKEEFVQNEVITNQQHIAVLEMEITEYKSRIAALQDESYILYQGILYEKDMDNPLPSIFSLIN